MTPGTFKELITPFAVALLTNRGTQIKAAGILIMGFGLFTLCESLFYAFLSRHDRD